jgi:signal transduction histidine kinase/dsRNA-specific ribonuclease
MNVVEKLSKELGLAESSVAELSVALTHESALTARLDASVVKALHTSLGAVGGIALDAAIIEWCLVEEGFSDQAQVNIQQPDLTKRVVDGLLSRFDLLSATQIGSSIAKTNFTDQEMFRANLVSRFLGAVVLGSSFDVVRGLVTTALGAFREEKPAHSIRQPKSCLQEITQRLFNSRPIYELVSSTGPDHNKVFRCKVSIDRGRSADGCGKTLTAAENDAALTLILNAKLLQQAPDIVQKYSSTLIKKSKGRGMGSATLNPAPAAIRFAEKLRPILDCEFMDTRHLAVALSLSNKNSPTQYDTHFRHKMLGSALESLALQIFASRTVRQELIASEIVVWVQIEQAVRSTLNYAHLYNQIGLERFIYRSETGRLSLDREADVIKAISGAAFLSVGKFNQLYDWMERKVGSWVTSYLDDLLTHPWKLQVPKMLLQELIQATGSFEVRYSTHVTGPDHEPVFQSVVTCNRIGEASKSYLGKGQASLKGEAEKYAAKNSVIGLMPREGGKPTFEIAPAIWKACIENGIMRKSVLPPIGLTLHLRMFKSVRAYAELKALTSAFPELLATLTSREFLSLAIRSASPANPFPIHRIRELTLRGIDYWTSLKPEDTANFSSQQSTGWLDSFLKLSNRLKLPSAPVSWPISEVDSADLTKLVRMNQLKVRLGKSAPIPSSSFAHIAILLESLDEVAQSSVDVSVQFARRNELHVAVIAVPATHFAPLQCLELIGALDVQAFFLGTEVSIQDKPNNVLILLRSVFPTASTPCTEVFFSILRGMYENLREIQSLYRILHDLKNQMIALQSYARLASEDQSMKYQYFARIDGLQRELRDRKQALTAFFQTVEEDRGASCDLFKTFQEFASRELYSLPQNIQLRLDTSIEPGLVRADADHLLSVLTNLTRNGVEAMPNGGDLAITAIYLRNDRQFLVQVTDTGTGIPEDKIRGLFTNLRSTKKGMGLGLATVNNIVSHYGGKVDVDSRVGRGSKFTVVLPLEGASLTEQSSGSMFEATK